MLGVAGLLILVLLLSMVAITLAEGKEQRLISAEEDDDDEEEGFGERGDAVDGRGRVLWAALKRAWTSLAAPFRGFTVNLQERNYIEVI